jgi:hypothetical protein
MYYTAKEAVAGVKTTGSIMRSLAITFASDVLPYEHLGVYGFYEVLRKLPYHKDPPGLELVKRPAFTLSQTGPGGDFDDKAVAMAAMLHRLGYKFRFLAAGRRIDGPLHHVWVQGYIRGQWVNMDATYEWNAFGQFIGAWPKIEIIG